MKSTKEIVCRCEEVTYQELQDTIRKHHCSARELKLRTRAGMGYCGGRTCRSMIDAFVENEEKLANEEIPLKYQAPIRPVPFGKLGETDDNY